MDANNFSAPVPPPPITAEELLRAQGAHGRCQHLRAVIHSGKPTRLVLDEEGRLVRRQPTTDAMQVYIPEALRGRVMGLEHYPTSKGDPGVQRMYAAMKRCFYWESMIVDLYDFARQCPPCAKNRLQERRHTSPMTLFPPKEPLTEVGICEAGSTVGGCVMLLSWRWREPLGGSLIRPRRPHALSTRRHPHSQHAYTHHAPPRAEGARATSTHAHSPSKC